MHLHSPAHDDTHAVHNAFGALTQVLSLICFIMSAAQVGSGESIHKGSFQLVGSCDSNATLAKHRPLRITIGYFPNRSRPSPASLSR